MQLARLAHDLADALVALDPVADGTRGPELDILVAVLGLRGATRGAGSTAPGASRRAVSRNAVCATMR